MDSRGQILDYLVSCDEQNPNSESGGVYGSYWSCSEQRYLDPQTIYGETQTYSLPYKSTIETMAYDQVSYKLDNSDLKFVVSFDFHCHGSGEMSYYVGEGRLKTVNWHQNPDEKDFINAGQRQGGRTFAAFGMRSEKVYFYDTNGTYATWTFDQFRNNN